MDYGFSFSPYEIYDRKCKAGEILSVFNGHEQDFGSGSDVFFFEFESGLVSSWIPYRDSRHKRVESTQKAVY